jgi:nitrite reductase/ring-hydroxylating ferredoxin subunit
MSIAQSQPNAASQEDASLEDGAEWVSAGTLVDLEAKGSRILRANGKQIVLFHTDHGVQACNNRCPHEGYPLKEGSLSKDCVLTCNWHNWKFDLKNGETLVGGDKLRRYPVEIREGEIFIDLTDPPADEQIARALENLRDSFENHEYDRMAREIARLSKAGGDSLEAVRQAIFWTHDHFEYGMTHAIAAAPDWLALRDRVAQDPATNLVPLVEIVGHLAWDSMRWGKFPYPEAIAPTFDADALVNAIETEDETAAIAQVRAAIEAPDGWRLLDAPLTRAAAAHYQDFGHSMIYAYKCRQAVEALGDRVAQPIYLAYVRGLIYASREDLIPEFRAYRPAREAWNGTGAQTPMAKEFCKAGVRGAVNVANAASSDPKALFDALMQAAAWQMLHFDLDYMIGHDRAVQDNVNWLDFTHAITFANAGRIQAARHPEIEPDMLLQLACFTGRNAPYIDGDLDDQEWRVEDVDAFLDQAEQRLFDHGQFEFIVACHLLKLLGAVHEEISARPEAPWVPTLLAAVNRFLNAPLKRKHTRRTARQALEFVALEG